MKQPAIVAMLTDFGLIDPYVSVMKGVIISINPHARIIDITHEVGPQNIDQASFLLWSSYRYFPKGTLFLCVVDPGVGSGRRILYVEAGGYRFLAPDNGLLKFVLGATPQKKVIDISNSKSFLPVISSTFHGRDIFSPVAAHILNGRLPGSFGKRVGGELKTEKFLELDRLKKRITARILHIDRFGNCITNVKLHSMMKNMTVHAGRHVIPFRGTTYQESPEGKPFWIIGSSGLLELSVRNSSAAAKLRIVVSDDVEVRIN